MFDFFKEVIINSNTLPREEGVDAAGNAFKRFYALTPTTPAEAIGADPANYRAPKEGVLRVLRCADYVKSALKDLKIYKTAGRKGKVAEVEINLAPLADSVTEPMQYRILVDISLENRYYSDYKYPWSEFHKPIMAEFEVTPGMDAKAIAEAAKKSLKLYIPSDYKYAVVTLPDAAGKLVLRCSDPYQVIKAVKVQYLSEEGCMHGCANPVYYDTAVKINITKNIAPFGTGEWLVENLRFPTYPNLRYAGVNDDEKPVAGALYTQFAFEYVSPRKGLHGQGTVGQDLVSVTHHVFYVLDSLVAEFEKAIKDAFGDVIIPITAELTILNAGEKFAGPMVVSAADVNGENGNNHVALQATFSGEGRNVVPKWSVTKPFKIGTYNEQAILTKFDAKVKAGDVGTLTASYKGISTTVQVVVK
jgi:hypothetical protein